MLQSEGIIKSNVKLAADYRHLTLDRVSEIAEAIQPGQFVNVRIGRTMDPLFRRPFAAVFREPNQDKGSKELEIVYKVVGKGTQMMSRLLPGDSLDIIGPCGSGFRFEDRGNAHVLLGGGSGTAALYMMGEQILKNRAPHSSLHILLGAKTKDALIWADEFENLKPGVKVSTEDGSQGYRGTVTELFENLLEEGEIPPNSNIYACGPEPMYRAMGPICEKYHLSAQVSIERRMACGMGVCLSCICKIKKDGIKKERAVSNAFVQFSDDEDFGYALSCMIGPVFRLEEVILDE